MENRPCCMRRSSSRLRSARFGTHSARARGTRRDHNLRSASCATMRSPCTARRARSSAQHEAYRRSGIYSDDELSLRRVLLMVCSALVAAQSALQGREVAKGAAGVAATAHGYSRASSLPVPVQPSRGKRLLSRPIASAARARASSVGSREQAPREPSHRDRVFQLKHRAVVRNVLPARATALAHFTAPGSVADL